MNAKSLKNLKPFKKGQSGNPAGRPQRRPITKWLSVIAETRIEESERKRLKLPRGSTYGRALAIRMYQQAIEGDIRAAKEIREAIEGKAERPMADEEKTLGELLLADADDIVLPSYLEGESCYVCGGRKCRHKRCARCDGCDECSEQPNPSDEIK